MIDDLLPPEAPPHEPLTRVSDRLVAWTLQHRLVDHPVIEALASMYDRRIADDEPGIEQWQESIKESIRGLAIARVLDADLADALYFARALHFGFAWCVAWASFPLASRSAVVTDLIALLGARLAPIDQLDATILDAVEKRRLFGFDMSSYHCHEACGTTHCRAGSAIALHPMGRELEDVFGSWLAGAVIYHVSTGRVPDFFASNEAALADMRASAAASEGSLALSELHVYRFDETFDWFVASSCDAAIEEWLEYHEEGDERPEPRQLPDEEEFELGDMDGENMETKTCAEWAEECGVGWLGREL